MEINFEINFVVISNEFSIPFQLKLLRVQSPKFKG